MTLLLAIPQPATPDQFVGCWRFNNGQLVRVEKDGTLTMGQLKGKWRLADPAKRVYVITWPEIQDNAVLSADEKTLTETNPWFTLTATRIWTEDQRRRSVRDAVRRRKETCGDAR